ncbi:mitogen-activated protein kinase kinase kinase 3 [Citrus sinensis]|uniref:Mitogen-activated protein kinase kinase kinase 3 n=1 Tax=Citrus sinensis TaxID=2711 RepID=A0ACB8JIY6_CITSI|nr:mitogen-activated protein kinase kinase kinase 3 [Citrus sinensis]
MPAWWGKKSSKNKDESHSPQGNHFNFIKFSGDKKKEKNDRPRSFDGVIFRRSSPRESKDYGIAGAGSSGFSGFDSDSGEKKGHPLPRPLDSIMQSDHGNGLGSGSGSVSSVSSSGSSEDHVIGSDQGQFGGSRSYGDPRVNGDIKFNLMPKSPSAGSRGPTSPTSPLHARLSGMSVDSPTGKIEDGKSQCHKLPLPPGSPTSPSALPCSRTGGVTENSLSKWKKGKLLGRGTFGHVYLGFNSESGQMCAIKEVRVVCDDQTSKECLKQLNQEINLLSQLSHPNIVRYHGSELSDERLSVYLEYVSGGSIHKLLQEYGPFNEPVIQTYTRQILLGLAYLHARNTVHRDIKGANILVDPHGEIKLADFGMAKHMTSCASMLSFKGSPYWMAPEVVMNTNGYSLTVDIWSLGCTVLEMATSKPPWSQYEGVAAIFKIGNSKDIPEIPEHLSDDAKSFIKQCLQRDPSARPPASKLLDHPFVRDQAVARAGNVNLAKDSSPYSLDGSRTPPKLDLLPTRKSITLCEGDYLANPLVPTSRALNNPRENARTITSLPVSPCSSPLRQYGPSHKSCFLSPPHPSYAVMGQSSGYNLGDYSGYPTRSNPRYINDPWLETSLLKAQTPVNNIERRSIPRPQPAAGGIPYSSACQISSSRAIASSNLRMVNDECWIHTKLFQKVTHKCLEEEGI